MLQEKENSNLTNEKSIKGILMYCLLAFQHLIAAFSATVLVPILTGMDISASLFTAGVGTLIFHLCTKKKVPVFLGSSFAFIPVICAVAAQYGNTRYAQGGIIVAGLIYVLIALLINKIGVDKIKKLLPAQVIGPIIIIIGVNLIPTALDMTSIPALLVESSKVNIYSSIVAIFTLGMVLIINKFGKGFFKQMSILISIVSGVILSAILGLLSTEAIVAANMISVPKFSLPLFNIGSILIIAPVALVTFMEHIGDITTNGTIVGKDFISDPGLNRTLMGDGLATAFAGLVGGAPNTTYGENTATLELTKNFNPKNLRLAAIFAIVLSFIGKFSAIVSSIPTCVMGGISLVLFTSISIVGVKTIKREKVKLTLKNLLIMVPIFVIGLSGILGLNIAIPVTATVSFSGLSLAAIAGIILNLVFKFVKVSFLEKSLINK